MYRPEQKRRAPSNLRPLSSPQTLEYLAGAQITRDLAIALVRGQSLIVAKVPRFTCGLDADNHAVKYLAGGKFRIIATDNDHFSLTKIGKLNLVCVRFALS